MKFLYLFSLSEKFQSVNGFFIIVLIGAIAGAVAGLIAHGKSQRLFTSALLGMIGGVIAHVLFRRYFDFTKSKAINEIIGAVIGALILTFVINFFFASKKEKDSSKWKAS